MSDAVTPSLLDDAAAEPTKAAVGPFEFRDRTCSVAACDRRAIALGLCSAHYQRARKYGSPGDAPIRVRGRARQCEVDGCELPHKAKGYCENHYRHFLKHGDPLVGGRTPVSHGMYSMYQNRGCRCDACRQANTDWHREASRRRGVRPREVVNAERRAEALARDNHGTETRYCLGCRCSLCRGAAAAAKRRRRARARVAA